MPAPGQASATARTERATGPTKTRSVGGVRRSTAPEHRSLRKQARPAQAQTLLTTRKRERELHPLVDKCRPLRHDLWSSGKPLHKDRDERGDEHEGGESRRTILRRGGAVGILGARNAQCQRALSDIEWV